MYLTANWPDLQTITVARPAALHFRNCRTGALAGRWIPAGGSARPIFAKRSHFVRCSDLGASS